jgi:hypothetical protein
MRFSTFASVREPTIPTSWLLNLYQEAVEGGGWFISSKSRGKGPAFPALRRVERSECEAARRVRLRRDCTANLPNRLGTLTFAGAIYLDQNQVISVHQFAFILGSKTCTEFHRRTSHELWNL